ncbi:tRNA (adenosine(37)-N6)-threonylcarbamoyltransferase complex ATPase subunit type 1 TsaE [Candidatus Fermentibacteria bacterium]|nr:MAG: tRNA (adenosine(37)-N6)-threonylcarbamoyltransferase complex ATPase subunit type 1 TsaE [Candidatus Fermentibacteria bacterium]
MISENIDEQGLEELAAQMANKVKAGDRFFIKGPLGSGKSTFARAFIRALGVQGAIPSPTFLMDSVYSIPERGLEVHHMDLYRLKGSSEELIMLGFQEILDSRAVVLVEWPERIPDLDRMRGCFIHITQGDSDTVRRISIERNMAGY